MIKKFALLLILIFGITSAYAEQIPVKIIPAENISTVHDEIQIGDKIMFKVQNDVYSDDTLIFAKDTPACGIVSQVEDNGWANDNAEIKFETFKLRDAKFKLVTVHSDVTINGFEMLKFKPKRFAQFFNYIGVVFRGKEIDIKCQEDKPSFTIWYN